MSNQPFSIAEAQALFKINYYKRSENLYNNANVLMGRIKKKTDFTGRSRQIATSDSFSGGVSSGTLPDTNTGGYSEVTISAKKVYARCDFDREAIKAASDDAGAFVKGTKETVEKTVESFNRNASRILFGRGDGQLGNGDGATNVTGAGTTGSPYVVVLGTAAKEANWEEKDYVNYNAETTLLEVVTVAVSALGVITVSLVGTSAGLAALVAGPGPVLTTVFFYMQKSKDNDPYGLYQVSRATSGTLYGKTVDRRWKFYQEDAGGAGLTTDIMNKVMLNVERRVGKAPNLIVTSYTQYRKLQNLLEDQKRYTIDPRDTSLKGKISWTGLEYMASKGPIGVFYDRFVEEDTMYFLNDNHIEIHQRPDFGWFDDDGTVFLRKADADEYEARYGGYYQNYIEPTFHGVAYGLAK